MNVLALILVERQTQCLGLLPDGSRRFRFQFQRKCASTPVFRILLLDADAPLGEQLGTDTYHCCSFFDRY
jgi:hypothetical protein